MSHDEHGDDGAVRGQHDDDLERLLRAAGLRESPPADLTADVRAAVGAEWRAVVTARQPPAQRRRQVWWPAAAASVAAAAIAVWLAAPRLAEPARVGAVARVDGTVDLRRGETAAWRPLTPTTEIRTGDAIRTGPAGRVSLRRDDGLEVRVDAGTTLAFAEQDTAALETGRLYVDAGLAHGDANAFTVQTALGRVRHLGTQYAVAWTRGTLAVTVREGSVAIERSGDPLVARAGDRVSLTAEGGATRAAVEPYGEEWHWTQAIAPAFAIEGRTLDEFLSWAARETGRQLVYASADAARAAEGLRLKGAVTGLEPEAAVAAVMTTTPALRHRFAGAQLRIERSRVD